ncbi:MAG TPA: hypothetical protein VKB86_14055 [Pyrinomonadaceae bacterium]|nr:hypothetical protein [Pyrinomonadaceae bacterium]
MNEKKEGLTFSAFTSSLIPPPSSLRRWTPARRISYTHLQTYISSGF